MRVFAGPNGSGKSTIIDSVKQYQSNGRPIDFGYYINADDIARSLRDTGFSFDDFDVAVSGKEFREIALQSGLINEFFTEKQFIASWFLRKNTIKLKVPSTDERMAQIIADFLRKKMLAEKKKFSFETVFSHPSKLDIMRQAAEAGYKVYLYFVSTENPEINISRVELRTREGGHDVPRDKIESRYYRSLELLYEASQIAYQAFFFDNSIENRSFELFAFFKRRGKNKLWDSVPAEQFPRWFGKYYSQKIKDKSPSAQPKKNN